MKSRNVKLIGLLSIVALLISLLAVSQIMAGPGSAPSGAVAGKVKITTGFDRADKAKFFSDRTGFNVVTVEVADADLDKKRTGAVTYSGVVTEQTPLFWILRGDGTSTGANASGVLQGENDATKTFTGDGKTVVFPLSTETIATAARTGDTLSVFALSKTFIERHGDARGVSGDDATFSLKGGAATAASGRVSATTVTIVGASTSDTFTTANNTTTSFTLSKVPGDRNADGAVSTVALQAGVITTGDITFKIGTADTQITSINSITRVVTVAAPPTGSTVTFTYTPAIVSPGDSLVFTYAANLSFTEAKASAAWNKKIPRDSGVVLATPAADGVYDSKDLKVVVDGKTLSSGDYTWSNTTHLVSITATGDAANVPDAKSANVSVSYKYSEFDGTVAGSSIPTPFGTVTATAGPDFATQQTVGVTAATSLGGFTDPAGTVRLAVVNAVVKIKFEYNLKETVKSLATVSTPTAVGAGKTRKPTGTESGASTGKFTFSVALFTVNDLNTIELNTTPTTTITGLATAVGSTGGLDTRITTAATALGFTAQASDLATSFRDLIVPIREGEQISVTYSDASPAGAVSASATIDLTPPTITLDQPVDKSFAGAQSTLKLTVSDSGAGLTLTAVADNLRTSPQVSGTVVESSTSTKATSYSLNQTATSAAPILEGKTSMWVGDNAGVLRDAVGNEPKGSGSAQGTDATKTRGTRGNTFQFTVDKAPPTLESAKTGGKLDTNPTSATVDQIIDDPKAKNAVTVTLDLGVGAAPIDADTVSPADFEVTYNLTVPIVDVIVGKVVGQKQRLLLRLGEDLPTSARPTVKLTGTLSDQAANAQTNVTLSDDKVVDALAPVVTGSIAGEVSSRPVARNQVTVTATSSESGTITGTASYLAVDSDGTLGEDLTGASKAGASTKALSFTSTGTGTWEATVKINTITGVGEASGLVNVQIEVKDDSGNAGKAGLADPEGTANKKGAIDKNALVFELDNKLNNGVSAPDQIFTLSPESPASKAGERKADTTDPFITVKFAGEAAEYGVAVNTDGVAVTAIKVDTHSDVTLKKATLTLPDATTLDVLVDFKKSGTSSFVMRAQGLALGSYKIAVQAEDALGNNSAKDVPTAAGKTTNAETFSFSFDVTARAKYTVSVAPGLNLMSLPGEPSDTDINSVIGADVAIDLVTTYDPSAALGPWLVATRNADTGLFEGTLTKIDAAHAYWMRASSFVDLKVDLPLSALTGQLPPTLAVQAGWNLVPIVDLQQRGFKTEIDSDAYYTGLDWSLTYTFDTLNSKWVRIAKGTVDPLCTASLTAAQAAAKCSTTPTGGTLADTATPDTLDDAVQVGRGYWVYANKAGTIVP